MMLLAQVLMAAHQALERLMDAMPPQRSLDILRYKLPSQESTSSGTAVDGDVLCATIRCEGTGATHMHFCTALVYHAPACRRFCIYPVPS